MKLLYKYNEWFIFKKGFLIYSVGESNTINDLMVYNIFYGYRCTMHRITNHFFDADYHKSYTTNI